MMKVKYYAFAVACMMAMALTGCSAGRSDNSAAPMQPTSSPASDYNDQTSAGVDDNTVNSGNVGGAENSGHVGDNYDQNNITGTGVRPSGGDNVIDDIGNAAGDLVRGAGNVARGAGNAVGNAANNIGGAMR